MGRYSNIYSDMWFDQKFSELTDSEKVFFIYLLTSPHCNMIGFYRLPIKYIMADLNLKKPEIDNRINTLSLKKFISYEYGIDMVLIHNYLRYNTPKSETQLKGAAKSFKEIPACSLTNKFVDCVNAHCIPLTNYIDTLSIPYQCPNDTVYTGTGTETDTEAGTETDTEYMHGDINPPCNRQPIITLTLNDKTDFAIYQEQIDTWHELYAAVDIMQELKKMKGWLNSNPKKRKTKSGILRFVNSWLAKEQDRGGKHGQNIGDNRQDTSGQYDTSKVVYHGDTSAADEEVDF